MPNDRELMLAFAGEILLGTDDDDNYPDWICDDCARSHGGRWPEGHVATFHEDTCGWCGESKDVTQPRDWGYPRAPEEAAHAAD